MTDSILPGPKYEDHEQTSWVHKLRHRRIERVHLAFLMVFASALGAVVAFWAAIIEQQTSQLQSQLTLGRMLEISQRHLTANDVAIRTALKARQRNLKTEATGRHKIADQIRQEAPEEAARQDIIGQQEIVLARSVRGLSYALRKSGKGKTTYEALSDTAIRYLASLGLGHVPDFAPIEPSAAPGEKKKKTAAVNYDETVAKLNLRLWDRIEEAIKTGHAKVPLLALGVVFFVSALVFFTISDLNDHRRVVANVMLFAGLFIMLGAAAFVLFVEPIIWKPLAVVLFVSTLFGVIGWRNGVLKPAEHESETPPPNELQPKSFVGAHMLLRVTPHSLSRWTVVLVAVSVFFSALVGYWYSQALTNANAASHRAFASQVALNNRVTERNLIATAGGVLSGLDLIQARIECAFTSQNALFIAENELPALANIAKLQRDATCERLKKGSLVRPGEVFDRIKFDTAENPTTRFLNDIYYRVAPNSAQLIALADGYLEFSDAFERKSTIFLLSITLFAIALYLFGQSLGMGTGLASRGLTVCGVILAGFSGGLAVWTNAAALGSFGEPDKTCEIPETKADIDGPEGRIELAAYYYSKAKPIIRVARQGSEFAKAAKFLDCAVAIRKNFAIAQFERGRAHTFTNTVEQGNTYVSLATKSGLEKVIESRKTTISALEEAGWSPTPQMLDKIGFNSVLLALATGNKALLQDAEESLNRGIDISGLEKDLSADRLQSMADVPIWNRRIVTARSLHFNLAMSRLAGGDVAGAEQAYDTALDVYGIGKTNKKKPSLNVLRNWRLHLGAALTDLNIVGEYCSKLYKDTSDENCGTILKAVTKSKEKIVGAFSAAEGKPSKARLTSANISVEPSRVAWRAKIDDYNPDSDHLEVIWYVLDSKEWNVWRAVSEIFIEPPQITYDSNTKFAHASYDFDTGFSNCVPSGKYKAEFYLNGKLVQDLKVQKIDMPEFVTYRSRELNLSMCHPKGWKAKRAADDPNGRHLVRGLINNDGKVTAYLFTFFAVRNASQEQDKKVFVERAWTWLKHILKDMPSDEQFRAATSKFKGCRTSVPSGSLLHKAWIMPDGMAHVAFVIANRAKGNACRILNSVGNYYDRGQAGELEPL